MCYNVLKRGVNKTVKNKEKVLSVRLSDDVYDKFKKICQEKDLPASLLARHIIKDWIKQHESTEKQDQCIKKAVTTTIIDRKYKDSLERSLARMENLSVAELANFILENNPPPVGWCMDIYVANGELHASGHYTTGTVFQYEPDVFIIASPDNRQGNFDPTKTYNIGTNWLLSNKFIEKYRDRYLGTFNEEGIYKYISGEWTSIDFSAEDINIEKMHKYIWEACMTKEEKEEEMRRMTKFRWLSNKDTLDWLGWCIEDTIRKIKEELEKIKEQEEKEKEENFV